MALYKPFNKSSKPLNTERINNNAQAPIAMPTMEIAVIMLMAWKLFFPSIYLHAINNV
jgi:hypothetical protein